MTRRSVLTIAALAFAAFGIKACKDATDGPRPGYLEARLASPNVDDGGLYFIIEGVRIDSVTTDFPIIATKELSDSLWHVVVGGNVGTGVVAKIWVPDTKRVAEYSGTMLEAAVRATNAQRGITGYSIIVATP